MDPRDYGLLVSLGSEFAAFDDSVPWLEREIRLFRAAGEADVPHLGICFGGQLLARTLGGESFRGGQAEIGWPPTWTRDSALVSEGPWFQWHCDTFTPPPDATVIAETDAGPQVYVVGRSMGVQFHPEVTPEIMENWVGVYRHELDAEGSTRTRCSRRRTASRRRRARQPGGSSTASSSVSPARRRTRHDFDAGLLSVGARGTTRFASSGSSSCAHTSTSPSRSAAISRCG